MSQLQAMLLSMAVEGLLAFVFVTWRRWPCRGPASAALASMIATAVTHPHLWTASLWLYPRFGYASTVVTTEAVVVAVEAGILSWGCDLRPGRAVLLSVLTNGATTLLGVAISLWEGVA